MHEGARDRNPLHLAAGKLMRQSIGEAVRLNEIQNLKRPGAGAPLTGQLKRKFNIFNSAQSRQQVEKLEHESNPAAAHCSEFGLGHFFCMEPVYSHAARRWKVHRPRQVEEGAFAATAAARQS